MRMPAPMKPRQTMPDQRIFAVLVWKMTNIGDASTLFMQCNEEHDMLNRCYLALPLKKICMTGHVLLMILKIPVGCPSEIWVVKPLTWSDSKVLTWIEIFYQNEKFTTNINFARYFIPAIKEEVTWDPFQEWALTGAMPGLVAWRSRGCPSLPILQCFSAIISITVLLCKHF